MTIKQTGTSELLSEDGELSMGISLMHLISIVVRILCFANDAFQMHVLSDIDMMIYANIVTTSEATSVTAFFA